MLFEQFDEHLPYFQFKLNFLLYCDSWCLEFENSDILATMNKTCALESDNECSFPDLPIWPDD